MKKIKTIIVTIALLVFSNVLIAQNLLPFPTEVHYQKGHFTLGQTHTVVNQTNVPATPILLDQALSGKATKSSGNIYIQTYPKAPNEEAYRLHIRPDSLIIEAATQTALTRAAATLLQLQNNKGQLPCVDIFDSPSYEWRGLMLDVSRHYFPLSHIYKQIDIMAQYKFNTLHLHLTDAAGWRMEIKRYPRLHQQAAFRPEAIWKDWTKNGCKYAHQNDTNAYGGYYTQDELRQLVQYTAERGINIVPEIEMPGHSNEVLAIYPELACKHDPEKQADFCLGNLGTYEFLENVLLEVMDVFPSTYIHIGGDEAEKRTWKECPLCQQKANELNLKEVGELQGHLIRYMDRFLQQHGRTLVGWDEIIADTLAQGTHVMNWRSTDLAHEAITKGMKVILSPSAYCYFDYYQDAPPFQPEAIGGFVPLKKVYSFLSKEELAAMEKTQIRGVQANLWAEYIPTVQHAEYMLYPRALAIAEIGWNGEKRATYEDFHKRALIACDQLKSQGINAFDLRKEMGSRKEYLHPVQHKALGKPVTYNLNYSPYYPAQKESNLTDGLRGDWTYFDGRWQGFIQGDRLDVTIDLGNKQTIREVSTGFMQVSGAEVFPPNHYIILISDDGTNFKELSKQEFDPEDIPSNTCLTYTWKGKTATRFLRVKTLPPKKGGWVFADEIIVK